MKITIIFNENLYSLEVSDDIELENFLALIRVEIQGLEAVEQNSNLIFVNGQQKTPVISSNLKKPITALGFMNDDLVYLLPVAKNLTTPQLAQASSITPNKPKVDLKSLISAIKVPTTSNEARKPIQPPAKVEESPEHYRAFSMRIWKQLNDDKHAIRSLKFTMPKIAEAYENNPNDFEAFHKIVLEEVKKQKRINLDENSAEAQEYIARQIRMQNIEEQYQYALEHFPGAYIPINLLHIRVKINGVELLGMVDSGAQNSIMSPAIARRCNLWDYVDERFFTNASGIGGSQKIKGRLHSCQVQVGGAFITAQFDVLEQDRVEILLGLTFLRPNHCIIDLQRNVLKLGDGSETPFLGEEEYKREVARLGQFDMHNAPEQEDQPTSSKVATAADANSTSEFQVDSGKLAELVAMGMDADKAANALKASGNDLQRAMDLLLDEPMQH